MKSKLVFDNFTMTAADTMGGVKYKQSLNSGTDIKYGCAAMSQISFYFRTANFDSNISFEGKSMIYQSSQTENGSDDYKTIGKYNISTVEKRKGKTYIIAYDNMYLFEKPATDFLKTILYPISVYSLLINICQYCGVHLINNTITNGNIIIRKSLSINSGTCRNLISYIADIAASNAYIDSEGNLCLNEYKNTSKTLTNSQYISCWISEYSTDPIDCVKIKSSNGKTVTSNISRNTETNIYSISDNPIINNCSESDMRQIANEIQGKLENMTYSPAEIELFQDFDINAGDIISVNGINTLVMEKNMKSGGVTLLSTGNKKRSEYISDEEQQQKQSNYNAENAKSQVEEVKESLKEYPKKNEVNASIDEYINSDTGKASIITSLSGTYTTKSDLDGYVKKTSLSAEIGAYIDTQAGTAKIVNNLSGTFAKEDSLGNYVEKIELSTEIGSYIDTQAGTAKIISAASGTYQKKSDMANYVTTNALNTSVGQYIDSSTGKAKIISACSGTYTTKSDLDGYAKVSAITSIEQSINELEADITLSSSYSKNTIGTNVYALLQLVSNANSSTIKIKADKIDFTGFTTFVKASDLGASGTTSIDGGRIKTGTISADRIDTSELRLNTIYGKGVYNDKILISSNVTSSSISILIGSDSTVSTADAKSIYLMTQADGRIAIGNVNSSNYLLLDISKKFFVPIGTFDLGSTTSQWNNIYAKNIYLNGTKLEASSGTSSGTDFSGKDLKLGGTTSYYVVVNTSRELRPNVYPSSSSYFYLGTSNYYWHYAYIGSNTTSIGNATSSKLGFFGTTPVAQQTLSTTSNNMNYSSATSSNYLHIINNLVGILKNKYGLIK